MRRETKELVNDLTCGCIIILLVIAGIAIAVPWVAKLFTWLVMVIWMLYQPYVSFVEGL